MNRAPGRRAQRRREAGFTLVELLVAFTLFSLLSLIVVAALRLGTQAWERGGQHSARQEAVLHAQTLLRRLIGNAYPRFIPVAAGAGYVDFDGDERSLAFLSDAPMSLDHGGRFRFTLSVEARDGHSHLTLRFRPELAAQGQAETSGARTLLALAGAVELAYFGRKRDGGAAQWHPTWRQERDLPDLVRIRIGAGEGDAGQWPELIVRPRIEADVSCVHDALTKRCRGR